MTTRNRTVTLLDSGKKPFLLRTGSVQQNASDKGSGAWSVPHSGFTGQLRYKTTAARFRGQWAGYTFHRYTATDGIFNGAGTAQQPHIWLFEIPFGSGRESVLENGSGQAGTTTGWSAGANTSISATRVSGTRYQSGTAIKMVRDGGSGSGTVSASQSSVTTAGKIYKIQGEIYRTDGSTVSISNGTTRIWPNTASDKGNEDEWVPVHSFKEFFVGSGTGDGITVSCGSVPETTGSVYFTLSIVEMTAESVPVWLCSEGAGIYYRSLDLLKDRAVTAINTASDLDYSLDSSGDLVCETNGYSVFAAGPVPWVCGWGYIRDQMMFSVPSAKPENGSVSSSSPLGWAMFPGIEMDFSRPRATRSNPVAEPDFRFEIQVATDEGMTDQIGYTPDFDRLPSVAIRYIKETAPNRAVSGNGELMIARMLKNRSEHAYYWQRNHDASIRFGASNFRTLYDAPSDPRLRYYTLTGSPLQVGDVIRIGKRGHCRIEAEGSATKGQRYIEVSGRKYASSSARTDNVVHGMADSLQWMTGWADYFQSNPDAAPQDVTIPTDDPWPIVDASKIRAANPAAIFKQLLGQYPASTDQDVGISPATACTVIPDLFGYTVSDRELIDWASLRKCVRDFALPGVVYSLDLPEAEGEEKKEINISQLLHGLCQTHEIRMVWKYSDAQRSWVLSFRKDESDSLAAPYLRNRVINEAMRLPEKQFEQNGGTFNYSGIKATYKRTDGGEVQFAGSDPSGRIQQMSGGKVLTISDGLTLLPSDTNDASEQLVNSFAARIRRLSMLSHKIKIQTTVAACGAIRVGDACVVDLDDIRDPRTGRPADGLLLATVDAIATTLNRKATCSVELLFSRLQLLGISPSLAVDAWTRTDNVVSVTGCATDPADNDFADPEDGLTDLALFDCYSYDDDRGMYLRNCGCSDYACLLIERGASQLILGTNAWTCTVGSVDVSSGTCALTLGTGYASFPASTSGRYILMFERRNSADLQPCQTDIYGWLGNASGLVTDSASATHTAIQAG